MPQIFKIGPYTIYFWSNENDPLVGPLWEHQLFLLSAAIRPNSTRAETAAAGGESFVFVPSCGTKKFRSHFGFGTFFFSLTKQGQDAIIKTERALLLAVSPSLSCNKYYADRLGATKRSASFYGQCQGQNDHKHEKFQKKLSHSSLTPFQKDFAWGEELTAIVRNNASFRPL